MEHPLAIVAPVAGWLGIEPSGGLLDRLGAYADWLVDEGVTIGGLGPAEAGRIWARHIADSLTFGYEIAPSATVLDVGTGIGLPGIPLAIAFPGTRVTMLDRSQRRTDAVRRVARVLALDIDVVTGDVDAHRGTYHRVVTRATFPPDRLGRLLRLVEPGGDLIAGLRSGPPAPTPPAAGSLIHVGKDILENGAWLLRMPVA